MKFVAESAARSRRQRRSPAVGPIVINEIHYNPSNSNPEFLELTNVSNASVDLTGWTFTNGITFTFGAASIDSAAFVVLTNSDPNTVLRDGSHSRERSGIPVHRRTG